jgi:peptidoglycan/LPS O-acetylase OafA/YrhL
MTSFSVDGLHGPPAWRDRLGAALLSVCAVGGIVAAISALGTVSDAGSATEAVETWRLVGFAFFAGIFVLLALAPRQLRGLWELTIAAKLALPVAGATFLRGSTDADTFVVFDGSVTVLLIAAYVSMLGWTARRPHRWSVPARRGDRAEPRTDDGNPAP